MASENTKIGRIKMLACDIDGVLTDGSIIYGTGNLEVKVFNIKDGIALKIAWLSHFPVVWITGRKSEAAVRRADELNVQIYQGMADKEAGLRAVAEERGLQLEEIAYIGDDLNDIPALQLAGYSIAPADAAAEVTALADYTTKARGGRGAIRETIEHIFHAQGRWDEAVTAYLASLKGVRTPGSGPH
ncbi:MAG: KdsC family phosphatase [Armatimonadota bacterium]